MNKSEFLTYINTILNDEMNSTKQIHREELLYLKAVLENDIESIKNMHKNDIDHSDSLIKLVYKLGLYDMYECLLEQVKSTYDYSHCIDKKRYAKLMKEILSYKFENLLIANDVTEYDMLKQNIDKKDGILLSMKYHKHELIDFFAKQYDNITDIIEDLSNYNDGNISYEMCEFVFSHIPKCKENFAIVLERGSFDMIIYWLKKIKNVDTVSLNGLVNHIVENTPTMMAKFMTNMVNMKKWNIVKIFSKIMYKKDRNMFATIFNSIKDDLEKNPYDVPIELLAILKNTKLFTVDNLCKCIKFNFDTRQYDNVNYRKYIDCLYSDVKYEYTFALQIAIWYNDTQLIKNIIGKIKNNKNFVDTLNKCLYVAIWKNNRSLIKEMLQFGANNYDDLLIGAVESCQFDSTIDLCEKMEYVYGLGAKNYGVLHEIGCSCQYKYGFNFWGSDTYDEIKKDIDDVIRSDVYLITIAKFIFRKYDTLKDIKLLDGFGHNYYSSYKNRLLDWAKCNNINEILELLDVFISEIFDRDNHDHA